MITQTTQKPYRKYALKFWERDIGALWLKFEREKFEEFSQVRANEKVSIDGYVKWISNDFFALTPTPFSYQIWFVCKNLTELRPSENAHIRVSGTTRWSKIRRPNLTPKESTLFKGDLLLEVHDWILSKTEFKIPKTNFTFKDFKEDLTYRIRDLEPKIADFLAFTAISTPTFYNNVGGINLTLYDSTKLAVSKSIVGELKRVIPSDIGQLKTIETPYGKFGMSYKFGFLTANADAKLSNMAQTFLAHKTTKFIKNLKEASLSLYSSQEKPQTIRDPPCSLSDIPTVVSGETSMAGRAIDPDFNSFKYMMVNQMKTPTISNFTGSLSSIEKDLQRLREKYGLHGTHISSLGFLNANYNARPTSILRNCLAYARTGNLHNVELADVSKIFKEYFEWNFKHIYEIWQDHFRPGGDMLYSTRAEVHGIIRIMSKNETSKSPVSIKTIIAESDETETETRRLVEVCMNNGIIYETYSGFYRLVHE